ncbi:chalcone isomerase family protein [Roseateles sp.]|uniref:chalcone isomerase family protein n=1 Tax=Roseateles sp. TaxID=1971397 RepID=UPI0025CF2764|nr:chalcone isomerase family protein [Roseateles sp.]MBV8034920.1 chalcone isomerase family protein [Roseateles sp.]
MMPSRPFVRRRAAILALAAATCLPVHAVRYEGQDFPDTLELGGSMLALNGTGKRQVAIYPLYLAALYLPQKAGTPDAIYAQAGPKRLELRIVIPLVKDVSTQEFVKAISKGVDRNSTEAEKAAVAERVKLFNGFITEVGRVKKGDLLHVDYLPDQGGTVLTVNGKVWGQPVEGQDFYTAFLKVFLGNSNSDARLRAGLLGRHG